MTASASSERPKAGRSVNTAGIPSLETRVRLLEDERSILIALHTYGHSLDYGYEDEFVDCWTQNGVLRWHGHPPYRGTEELRGVFRWHTHAPETLHKHLVIAPRVAVDGDQATVDSYFVRLDDSPDGPVVRSFGRYRDTLVRCDDQRWRFDERRHEPESRIPSAWLIPDGIDAILDRR